MEELMLEFDRYSRKTYHNQIIRDALKQRRQIQTPLQNQ